MLQRITAYWQSFFTRLGLAMGGVMYVSYALPTGRWGNSHLIAVALVTGFFLPTFATLSDVFERQAIRRTGSIFAGKAARFAWQFAFNIFALEMLIAGDVVARADLAPVGGALGAVVLMSFASQGVQYLMIELVNRDIGNRYLNIVLALSLNIVVGALAALGFRPMQVIFVGLGLLLGFVGAGYSLVSDLMGRFARRGGIGVFFGTFNPAHASHMAILHRFIEERGLDKVYLHSTVVPRFHQALLDEGVIEIAELRDGMRVYRKTGRSDMHMDYFPTGNAFFEIENRLAMLHAAVEDAGLQDKVEVLYLPRTYARRGFRGVIAHVRRFEPGRRLHGLHGSDYGGVVVRMIYDSAFVRPFAVVRKDKVSATAIRAGGSGMTTPTVDRILATLRDDVPKRDGDVLTFGSRTYVYRAKRLYPADGTPWSGEPGGDPEPHLLAAAVDDGTIRPRVEAVGGHAF